ncbi:hypothetical protein BH23DEI1_BH23DEI1_16960 [soil metagenome]
MPTTRTHRILIAWATLAAFGMLVAAPDAEESIAAIRFIHLSSDTPRVDVLVSGALVFRDVALFQRSEIITLPAGQHEIRVYPHRPPRRGPGGTEGNGAVRPLEPVVLILDFAAGSVTTLALAGAYEPPIEEGARGALSLRVSPAEAELTIEGPRGYRGVFQGDQFLVDLEPGPYRAVVRHAGYTSAEYETEVVASTTSLVSITLQERGDGDAPDAPVQQSAQQATWQGLEVQPYTDAEIPLPSPGAALVRFVHAAPTVPGIDVFVRYEPDGNDDPPDTIIALEVAGLASPNRSPHHEIQGGIYDLEFRIASTTSVVHSVASTEFLPGATYTIFVTADPVTNQIWLIPTVDAIVAQHVPVTPGAQGEP